MEPDDLGPPNSPGPASGADSEARSCEVAPTLAEPAGVAERQSAAEPQASPDRIEGPIFGRSAVRAAAVGVALVLAVDFVVASIETRTGEPSWFRWLRVLADHPVRGALAAMLLGLAFDRRSPAESGEERSGSP